MPERLYRDKGNSKVEKNRDGKAMTNKLVKCIAIRREEKEEYLN